MEDTSRTKAGDFEFLKRENVQEHFAELTFSLLSGYHISSIEDVKWYGLLDEYLTDWKIFFAELYGMMLMSETWDGESYYFLELDYNVEERPMPREQIEKLEPFQVIVAFMLLNHYYKQLLSNAKVINWSTMREEIFNGEFNSAYHEFFFEDKNPTPNKIAGAKTKFNNVCRRFVQLGWLRYIKTANESEPSYLINISIHRILRIYKDEFESFSKQPSSFSNSEILRR